MKCTKIIFVVLILLLKTKASAIGTIDTTDVIHFLITDTTPVFDPGAYVKGVVFFDKGFSLSSTSTLQFGSLGIVNETIAFNGSTLKLTSDLHLGTNVTLSGPGYIDFNGYSIILSGNVTLTNLFFFYGAAPYGYFEGNGNTLNISTNGSYITKAGEGSPKLRNITIEGIYNIAANTSNFQVGLAINANNCTFIFKAPGETVALDSNLEITGACEIIAPYSTIAFNRIYAHETKKTTLQVSDNTTIKVTYGIEGNTFLNPFELTLNNNTNLEFTNSGAWMSSTKLIINGNSTLTSIPTLTFGDSEYPEYDNDLVINPGSKLTVDNRTTINDNCLE
jgi:hypothetical protein